MKRVDYCVQALRFYAKVESSHNDAPREISVNIAIGVRCRLKAPSYRHEAVARRPTNPHIGRPVAIRPCNVMENRARQISYHVRQQMRSGGVRLSATGPTRRAKDRKRS